MASLGDDNACPLPASLADGRFTVLEQLGCGRFGKVHKALDNEAGGEEVAIKFEDMLEGFLIEEAEVLRKVHQHGHAQGFTQMLHIGVEQGIRCLVMECLGHSLLQCFKAAGGRFSVSTTALIAEQAISSLEYLHAIGVVHRDIKPENFLTGRGDRLHHIFLTDFGLAVPYHNGKVHLPREPAPAFCGSFRYASITAHELYTQSRRDDLEAVGYMLIFLTTGTLPWIKVAGKNWEERNRRVLEIKDMVQPEELAAGLPECFEEYLDTVRDLEYDERPDYGAMISMFQQERLQVVGDVPIQDHDVDWAKDVIFPNCPTPLGERRLDIRQPDDLPGARRSLRKAKEKTKRTFHKLSVRRFLCAGSARIHVAVSTAGGA